MTCISSLDTYNYAQRRVKNCPSIGSSHDKVTETIEESNFIIKQFEEISKGVKIKYGSYTNMYSVLCLFQDAFPIAVSNNEYGIEITIIAGSVIGRGRVMCFGQSQLLSRKFGDTSKLMTNSITWISGEHETKSCLLPIGFSEQDEINTIQDLEFSIKNGSIDSDFGSFNTLIISLNLDVSNKGHFDKIVDFVISGGGLAVFYKHEEH